jgi:replicative DNA helicase
MTRRRDKTTAERLREQAAAGNGTDRQQRQEDSPSEREPWEPPGPLGNDYAVPPFPVRLLPAWAADWVAAVAEATQTPPDLAAMLVLGIAGAALAKKFRVVIREGWADPLNIFVVSALLVGERKSAVFTEAIAPVQEFEAEEQARLAPVIAEKTSERRTLGARLKYLEGNAAKAKKEADRTTAKAEAAKVARELAAHEVPETPQLFCDDVTPEKLANLLARHGGRMLQASAEGTAFEIAKGRYSESVNIDVFLKGHTGDPLRVARVGREADTVDQPALSVALAVQPDVIQGLAEQATMKARGFLARFLYSLPNSRVGSRKVRPAPVPFEVRERYRRNMLALWRLKGAVDEHGKPAPHWLRLDTTADGHVEALERWLEPQLAEGEELAHLGGWANKLAGTVGRIAGILHMMGEVGRGGQFSTTISAATVSAAVQIGRDYALPHALAAFGLMGADKKTEDARRVWENIRRRCASSAHSADAPSRVTRRDIHSWNRRGFPSADQLDPVLEVLVRERYLRPVSDSGQPGKGHKSPAFLVNPLALATHGDETPRAHCSHSTHSEGNPDQPGDAWEGD